MAWITATDYKVDLRRGPQFRPVTRLDLVAKDSSGKSYEIRIDSSTDRPALAKKILKLLSEIWPGTSFDLEHNTRNVITDVRK